MKWHIVRKKSGQDRTNEREKKNTANSHIYCSATLKEKKNKSAVKKHQTQITQTWYVRTRPNKINFSNLLTWLYLHIRSSVQITTFIHRIKWCQLAGSTASPSTNLPKRLFLPFHLWTTTMMAATTSMTISTDDESDKVSRTGEWHWENQKASLLLHIIQKTQK